MAAAQHLKALRTGGGTTVPPSLVRREVGLGPPFAANLADQSPPPLLLSPVFPAPSAVMAAPLSGVAAPPSIATLAQQDARGSREDLCGQCQEAPAELHCRECRERFCRACSANLHQRGRLREHTQVPLNGGGSLAGGLGLDNVGAAAERMGAVERSKSPLFGGREVYCPLHPEDHLQFFCLTCESECICAECAVHGEHRGHDVLNVRHAYKNMSTRIADALSKAQARTDDQQKALQLANSQRQEVELVIEKGKQAIQEAFEKMRTSLGQKEAQLLRDAEQTERLASEQLQNKTLAAEGHVRTLQEAQTALRKLETRGDEVKALNSYARVRSKVLTVLGPMDGLDHSIERELEELKSQVQGVLDSQVAEVSVLSSRVADIRRADASTH